MGKSIEIVFSAESTHEDVIRQFVEKLAEANFAPEGEIIEHLKVADILLKDTNRGSK